MILRRRLLGGGAVWLGLAPLPRLVQAQERRRISILHSGFPNRTPIHLLFEALQARGFENGGARQSSYSAARATPSALKR